MFVGHFGVGFGSKAVRPRVPLAWLVAAPVFLDLLWPLFLIAGVESVRIAPGDTAVTPLDLHDYPYSHSLLMAVVWSVLFGGAYFARHRDRAGAALLGAGVFSHWVLDFVTHRPDMPLYPGSTTLVGLGLWNSVAGTVVVEMLIFLGGVFLYARATAPRPGASHWPFRSLVFFLLFMYAGNLAGPPPPSVGAIEVAGVLMWLLVPWAAWVERTRVPTEPGRPGTNAPADTPAAPAPTSSSSSS
ncbi:MAG: hypothetical protein R3A78_09565 [Polyangiales bacterium]|nr:hypothetical protein [Myxococcales bacterium]